MSEHESVNIGGKHGWNINRDYWNRLNVEQRDRYKFRPRVTILGFGGTIAMAPNEQGVLTPAKTVEQLIEQVPNLNDVAEVTLQQVENKDSTNVTPNDWRKLISRIADVQHSGAGGVIITHGTDTMAYTAGAVALALGRGLKIPVVFTGSQLPMGAVGTDARRNVENAMRAVVAAREAGIAEVMISFDDKVLRGARAIKVSESRFDAFDSPAIPPLGSITATGVTFQDMALREDDSRELHIKDDFARNIFTVDVVPGLDPAILKHIIQSGKCRGLLLKSLGAGNVPSEGAYSLLPVIKQANMKDIPVLISTKFEGGTTHMELYEPGKRALDIGAIPTGDMTDVMAQIKLMWLLGGNNKSYGRLDIGRLKNQIATNYVGEITE